MSFTSILTHSNPKLQKGTEFGYLSAVIHLAPFTSAGCGNMCPAASNGCMASCLHFAGNPIHLDGKLHARKERTRLFVNQHSAFMGRLVKEIAAFQRKARKLGLKAAIRLNGTSDVDYHQALFSLFPEIQFYDYTKRLTLVGKARPVNYHLTFSASENVSDADIQKLVNGGQNVAVVFRRDIPATFLGLPVVDGTQHDLRFLDPKNSIVGLVALGRAKKDATGFVRDVA